jgi:hypothetical protein
MRLADTVADEMSSMFITDQCLGGYRRGVFTNLSSRLRAFWRAIMNHSFTMRTETRRDIVLVLIIFLLSAAGMTSVFLGCQSLAWIVIVISDLYLFIVLLLAAVRSDDEGFLDRHSWIAGLFPRRTAGLLVVTLLFLAVVSGFAGLYVGTEVFRSIKTPLDALYISSFTLAFTDYSPKPGYGQLVVLGQLVSGVLLLVALFPLLISRISTFKNP